MNKKLLLALIAGGVALCGLGTLEDVEAAVANFVDIAISATISENVGIALVVPGDASIALEGVTPREVGFNITGNAGNVQVAVSSDKGGNYLTSIESGIDAKMEYSVTLGGSQVGYNGYKELPVGQHTATFTAVAPSNQPAGTYEGKSRLTVSSAS